MGHVEFKAKLGPDKGDKPSKVPSEYGSSNETLVVVPTKTISPFLLCLANS